MDATSNTTMKPPKTTVPSQEEEWKRVWGNLAGWYYRRTIIAAEVEQDGYDRSNH